MASLIYCEFLKLRRSKMLLISTLGAFVTPCMMMVEGVKFHFSEPYKLITLSDLYHSCITYTLLLFGLIVSVVIAAYLFSREHTEKTLKTILTIPVSKVAFILSKFIMLFIWIMALMILSWFGMFLLAALYHALFGLSSFSLALAIAHLWKMIFGGIFLFFTITPFVFLAIWTKNLVVPIIAAATIAMGNVALSNEALGALFPWTAFVLLIDDKLTETGFSYPLVIGIIAFVSILGFLASIIYFQKEDIK